MIAEVNGCHCTISLALLNALACTCALTDNFVRGPLKLEDALFMEDVGAKLF
jgi:hypothetical protein